MIIALGFVAAVAVAAFLSEAVDNRDLRGQREELSRALAATREALRQAQERREADIQYAEGYASVLQNQLAAARGKARGGTHADLSAAIGASLVLQQEPAWDIKPTAGTTTFKNFTGRVEIKAPRKAPKKKKGRR